MRLKYTPEVQEYIRDHAKGTSYQDMADQLLNVFGLEVTARQMQSYYKNHNLRSGLPAVGHHHPNEHPKEVGDLIREYAAQQKTTPEITRLINERLGEGTIRRTQVVAWMKNHHVTNGFAGTFKKGNVPVTAGKTWDEFMSKEAQARVMKNLYPKGHVPDNIAEIGEIRVNSDGYLVKKVQHFGTQRKRWRFLHRIIWEEAHGPVPEGCVVSFADGNRQNCSLENLILETKGQHAIKNKMRWKSWNRESAEAYSLMADLQMTASKRKRREK